MKLLTVYVGVASLALLMSCKGSEPKNDGPVHSVVVVEPNGCQAEVEKTFSGIVEENREIGVGFKTAGQISRILVKEGDMVSQGQLIATLDDKDYKLAVEASRIQYAQMEREVARMRKLHESKSLAGNDFDKALSSLEQLKVQLQSNQNKLSYTKLYAPTSGYVQRVNFEASEMVNAGSPIINLLDVKQMEVTFNIPASLYLQKDFFRGFTCSGTFSEGRSIPLRLLSITPKADNNQLYKVRLGLNPADAKSVTSGMNVEVKIDMKAGVAAQGISVPISSVCQKEGKSYVWVLNEKESTVSRKEVTTGALTGQAQIIITSGLTGSEKVVKAGVNVLQDSEKVKVIGMPSKTNVGGLI